MRVLFYNVFALCAFVLMGMGASAQCVSEIQIAVNNNSMEDWAPEGNGNYEDPSGGFWETANKTVDLFPLTLNPNVTKSTDAHSGTYSAKLETTTWFGQLAAGTVFSGEFEPNISNPSESIQFGKPWAGERPEFFRFWYQFEPVMGDSAECYVYLTVDGMPDTQVGEAYVKIKDATSGWTEMEVPFTYFTNDVPNEIAIVFASSAAGGTFEGQVGTTLYVDDVELYNCSTGVTTTFSSEISIKAFPNPVSESTINFAFSSSINDGMIRIFSNDGKEVRNELFSGEQHEVNLDDLALGLYRFVIYDNETSSALGSGSFILK